MDTWTRPGVFLVNSVMCRLFLFLILMFTSGAFSKTLVAVVETKATSDALTKEEKFFLTDKLREIANRTLPAYQDFSIMTRENIEVMLPPGKTIEECEGSCLAETGRNIAVDFIAQARVGRFAEKLTLTVEMYESRTGKLISSFTGTSDDAVSLLDVIEREAVGFFRKANRGKSDSDGYVGPDGFSGYTDGEAYSVKRTRSFIVQVKSVPGGALLSVDGDPVPNCKETPCKIQLEAGSHRFSLVADMYQKKDSIINVQQGSVVEFKLKPLFGILEVVPSFERDYHLSTPTYATLDGDDIELGKNRLKPGTYELRVSNDCYEPVSTTVTVRTGSQLKFDKTMKVALGGLTLSAIRDDEPVDEPVYIDGKYAGKTPFSGTVPVCAAVSIGKERNPVPVTIPYHDETDYTYQFESNAAYEEEELGDAPHAIATRVKSISKSRGSDRISKLQESTSVESSSSSSSAPGEKSSYFQVALGIWLDMPLGETAFDDSGLDFMLGVYYVEGFLGWKLGNGMFMGLGAGVGIHDPLVMDSSSTETSCSYYNNRCISEDDAEKMLPSPSVALLLSAEWGWDFKMDAKYEAAFGLRVNGIVSSWPAFSLGAFFEVMSFAGMELGYTTITGDDLWKNGSGVSMKLYFRFPSRPGVSLSLPK